MIDQDKWRTGMRIKKKMIGRSWLSSSCIPITQSNHAIQCYIHIHPRWHYDELSQESKSRWGYEVWKPTSSWRWTRRECWWPSNIIILSELVNVKYRHCIRTGQCLATFLFFFHSPMQQVYIVQNKNFHSLPLTFYCNLLCCFIQTSMVILIVGWCGWWDGRRHRFYWAKAWPIYCLSLQVIKYILHYILTVWVLLVYFKVWPPWLP